MVGTTLAHYRVLSLLGRGGMGEVFLAEDMALGRKVALKILPATLVADSDRQQRFEREARAIAALNHPGIVTIYGIERIGDATVLAMEFVDGQPLAQLIPDQGMPLSLLLRVAIPLAEAIGFAHRQGIVHRDLKPGNVMVTGDGRVKVLDFGLAKLFDRQPGLAPDDDTAFAGAATRTSPGTQLGTIVGTVHYMAPEQAQGLPVDHRADIFSLGVVLYEMAAGVRPFGGDTAMAVLSSIIKEPPRALAEVKPDLPLAFTGVVERCLEKDRERRLQDAFELRDALDDVADALSPRGGARSDARAPVSPGTEPVPAPTQAAARPRRRRLLAGAAGLALMLAAAAGTWWLFVKERTPAVPIAPDRVALAPIVNRTGDASLDAIGSMASASIARLLALEGIDVVQPKDAPVARASKPRSAGDARADLQLGRRLGAARVVSGDVAIAGEDLMFQGRIADVQAQGELRQFDPIVVPRSAANDLPRRMEQQVVGATLMMMRGAGGITGFSAQQLAIMELPTYDAYKEFLAGLEQFGTNMPGAARHFERVLELDPRVWWCLGWLMPAYETLGRFDKAEAIVEKMRPSVPPVGRTMLQYFSARLGGRLVDAHTSAASMAFTNFHLPSATVLAWTATAIGRPQEALDALRPFAPDPRVNASAWRGWVEMNAQAHHMLGQYRRRTGRRRKDACSRPGHTARLSRAGARARGAGRTDDLGEVLNACLTVPPAARPRPGAILVTAASELRAHRRAAEAKQVAEQALRLLDGLDATMAGSVPMQMLRGEALTLLERWSDASAVFAKVAASAPSSIDARSEIGVIAAKRGDVRTARKMIDELAQINRPYVRGAHTLGRARIAAALGERERTVEFLREAFAEGQPLAWPLHADYAFEALRGYAPFDELTAMNRGTK